MWLQNKKSQINGLWARTNHLKDIIKMVGQLKKTKTTTKKIMDFCFFLNIWTWQYDTWHFLCKNLWKWYYFLLDCIWVFQSVTISHILLFPLNLPTFETQGDSSYVHGCATKATPRLWLNHEGPRTERCNSEIKQFTGYGKDEECLQHCESRSV